MLSLTWLYIGVLRNQNAFFNYCFNNIELRDQLVVCKYSLGSPVFTKFRFT
jgi:hypothetical protein